jgi:hypothetical protein
MDRKTNEVGYLREGSGLARAILADELLDVLEQPYPLVGRCARAGVVMDRDASAFVVPDRRYEEDGADLCALVFAELVLELLHESGRYFAELHLIYWHLLLLGHSLATSSRLYVIRIYIIMSAAERRRACSVFVTDL